MLLAQSLGAWAGMVAPRLALIVLLTAFILVRLRSRQRTHRERDFR
jgi:hypothetical protein